METIIKALNKNLSTFFKDKYPDVFIEDFLFQPTNKDHTGHLTLMVFPLAKKVKQPPEFLANSIGEALKQSEFVEDYGVIKGFLNLTLSVKSFQSLYNSIGEPIEKVDNPQKIVLEYCGPNTNKPLHIGHLRNMFLGYTVTEVLRAVGHQVHKVNIFNDRGIAICKSMLAYKLYGNGETPSQAGLKPDFLVGKYYVKFSEVLKHQTEELTSKGLDKDVAERESPILKQANEMLVKWEDGDKETIDLWNLMNSWFYEGVRETYDRLGIDTEKDYYESKEYKKGKDIVEIGHKSGVFQKDESGAIYLDLTDKGLDKKFLQRSNGTSLYITQDMALVKQRFDDYHMDKMIYVVGDEQNYHFKVLRHIMEAMNEPFSKDIYHLSYGHVLGKDGSKFKSREGTAADADLIVNGVVAAAKEQTMNSGKAESLEKNEIEDIAEKVGLGALKYAMLRVTATKKIVFDPQEAVDVNGDTGAFIQYTYVRTISLLKKMEITDNLNFPNQINKEEEQLILQLANYNSFIHRSANQLDPSEIAIYTLQLAKFFNRFYTQHSVLKEENDVVQQFRMNLTNFTNKTLGSCLLILGIPLPDRM